MSDKKLALVTGASRGIGFAIAERLIADGYRVVGTATSEAGAESLQAKLHEHGDEHSALVLNISDSEQTEAALKALLSECGTPFVVVNNAGITRDNLFLRLNEDDWNA
ncbi:MAG TPA: 3-oxoacyl-ACP reductase, partial [Oceanospirillales bacterium]|nr:3-oxoacyl-ACP reductase [Oceanospirillales bacterium]